MESPECWTAMKTDFLVIGSGIAGLRAAIELGRHPVLLKVGKFSYGVLAGIFKSFKG